MASIEKRGIIFYCAPEYIINTDCGYIVQSAVSILIIDTADFFNYLGFG